jgi:hypothetical protein
LTIQQLHYKVFDFVGYFSASVEDAADDIDLHRFHSETGALAGRAHDVRCISGTLEVQKSAFQPLQQECQAVMEAVNHQRIETLAQIRQERI